MTSEQAYILIGKVLSGEAADAEKQWLSEWLAASEANQAEFSLMQKAWQASEAALQAGAFPQPDTRAAWAKVRARTIGANPTTAHKPKVLPMKPPPPHDFLQLVAGCGGSRAVGHCRLAGVGVVASPAIGTC